MFTAGEESVDYFKLSVILVATNLTLQLYELMNCAIFIISVFQCNRCLQSTASLSACNDGGGQTAYFLPSRRLQQLLSTRWPTYFTRRSYKCNYPDVDGRRISVATGLYVWAIHCFSEEQSDWAQCKHSMKHQNGCWVIMMLHNYVS